MSDPRKHKEQRKPLINSTQHQNNEDWELDNRQSERRVKVRRKKQLPGFTFSNLRSPLDRREP